MKWGVALAIGLLAAPLAASAQRAIEPQRVDSQALLQFIIAPETPHAERDVAVALRGRNSMPPEMLPRILAVKAELAAEQKLHNWGMKFHSMDSRPVPGNGYVDPPALAGQARTVLGHEWHVPQSWLEYPITPEQQAAAPWPWLVQQAIDRLYAVMTPWTHEPGSAPTDEQDRWLAACLTLPLDTDDQAWEFVQASANAGWTHVSRPIAMRILARWRAIALNPLMPAAATNVAREIRQRIRTWTDPELLKVGEVIVTDIIRSPAGNARGQAARSLKELAQPGSGRGIDSGMTAILAAAEAAVAPYDATPFDHLNAFAYSVAEAVPDPPFVPQRGNTSSVKPGSPEVAMLSSGFERWFADNRNDLARRAAARELLLAPIRQALDAERMR